MIMITHKSRTGEGMKKTEAKRKFSILTAWIMALALVLPSLTTVSAAEAETSAQLEGQSVEVTDAQMRTSDYDTYYYWDQNQYTYSGETASFLSESQIEAGGVSYDLKNKSVTVDIAQDESGSISILLSGLSVPVGQISGAWNSTYGGTVQAVYQTDIGEGTEVRSEARTSLPETTEIELGVLESGTYHLSGGQIYEKANEWSPGYDFGDGKGMVKEAYFSVLPDITVEVTDDGSDVTGPEEPGEGVTDPEEPGKDPEEPGQGGESGSGSGDQGDVPGSITDGYIGVKTEARVYDDFENDIWLQYQQKEMEVGETASLYPWRLEQIVTNTITNDVFRPAFHFEVIAGDSVSFGAEEGVTTYTSGQKAIVTAVKPGTSIVKVTYDAADYKGTHWGAVSDVNTAYVVFTVGETGSAVITANNAFNSWRHYDTIYYNEGETVPYTFTVDTQNASEVKVTCNGLPVSGNGNQYTANLENRSNIIGIETKDESGAVKSMWRVIDARFIEVQVTNKTDPDQPLEAGDTANISFRGITMPIYKLATIYNPQMGRNATKVIYANDSLGTFEGKCSQWDLAKNNDFDVTFPADGDYVFSSDRGISCAWWGSPLWTDTTVEGQGDPNLSAQTQSGDFSFLPSFTVHVGQENGGQEPDPGEDDITASISPETIHPGTEVTVTLENLKEPDTGDKTVRAMETRYDTDLEGLETVKSEDAAQDAEKLKTLTFAVPEDTEPGTYYLTNGRVYKKYGGQMIQGVFLVGAEEKEFYIGEMPDIMITVTESDEVIAARVTARIDELGSTITLLQKEKVLAARSAYEALTDVQKALVTNLDKLEAAEKRIAELEAEKEEPQLPVPPSGSGTDNAGGTGTSGSGGAGSAGNGSGVLVQNGAGSRVRTTAAGNKVNQQSKTVSVEADGHKVSKSSLEEIKGQDKNLKMTDTMADGTKYTLTINGKDIEEAAEINTEVTKQSSYEAEIRRLAPAPEIFVFMQDGNFPGELLAELPTDKPDGDYLLFQYDPENGKAVYMQKVTVSDGNVKFVISEGGHYFIDERARTVSVFELEDENETAMLSVADLEEEKAGIDQKSVLMGVLLGFGITAVFGGGYLLGKKGRRKQR